MNPGQKLKGQPASHCSDEGCPQQIRRRPGQMEELLGQRPVEQDDEAGSVLPDLRERWARRYPI